MKSNLIGFLGISHLSITYALAFASRNYKVSIYDKPNEILKFYDKGRLLISEPNFDTFLEKFGKNINFISSIKNLKECSVVFLAKDVKTSKTGESKYVEIDFLLKNLSKINKKSTLVVLSQVYPGFTRKINWPKEKLFYQVETLIFGEALSRALRPERIIIGTFCKKNSISKDFQNLLKKFSKRILLMNFESAELCKMSINAYLISQVTLTNKLNEVTKKLGAEWEDIKKALSFDKRIGNFAYLKPGLGISGGNLERDLFSLKNICKIQNINFNLFNIFREYSKFYKNWINRKIKNKFKNKTISIIGLTYKINTNSIKNSPSLDLLKENPNNKFKIYDPMIDKINLPKKKYLFYKNLEKDFFNTDIIVIFNLYPQDMKLVNENIKKKKKIIIVDPYKLLKVSSIKNREYFTL